MHARAGFLKCHSNDVRRREIPAVDPRVVELPSSGRCSHPSDDRQWIAGSSICPRRNAAVIRRMSGRRPPGCRSVADGTLLSAAPFGHQPPGRCCRLLSCPRRNAAVIRWTSGPSVLVGTPPSAAVILFLRPLRYVNSCSFYLSVFSLYILLTHCLNCCL